MVGSGTLLAEKGRLCRQRIFGWLSKRRLLEWIRWSWLSKGIGLTSGSKGRCCWLSKWISWNDRSRLPKYRLTSTKGTRLRLSKDVRKCSQDLCKLIRLNCRCGCRCFLGWFAFACVCVDQVVHHGLIHAHHLRGHLQSGSPGLVELLLCQWTGLSYSSGIPFGAYFLETLILDVVGQVNRALALDRSEAGEKPLLAGKGGLGIGLDEVAGRRRGTTIVVVLGFDFGIF